MRHKLPNLPRRRTALLPDPVRIEMQQRAVAITSDMGEILAALDPNVTPPPEMAHNIAAAFDVSPEIAARALQAFVRAIYMGKAWPLMETLHQDTLARQALADAEAGDAGAN